MIRAYHVHSQYEQKQHDVLLNELEEYLRTKYNAEIINKTGEVIFVNNKVIVSDCDLLIEYVNENIFKGITFADNDSSFLSFFKERNNPEDILLTSQYNEQNIKSSESMCKLKKSIYITASPKIDIDYYYNKRQEIKEYKDKFYFRGNINAVGRTTVPLLLNSPYFEGGDSINYTQYFEELINYKVGLCIPGVGEFCYRDIEYMGIGIPMIKFEYLNELHYPLIPNYHYISIDRIGDVVSERNGTDEHSNAYIKRFLEVKDDKEFLDFISKNAREYYENYLHESTRLNKIIELLEI